MNLTKDIDGAYSALYKLNTFDEEEIDNIYEDIEIKLIDTKVSSPIKILKAINLLAKYRNKYFHAYLYLYKKLIENYGLIQENSIPALFQYFLNEEYSICVYETKSKELEEIEEKHYTLDIHEDNTIYKAIMNDQKEIFISFIEKEGFDETQKLISDFYPESEHGLSLLEFCCYHGAIECFKILRKHFEKIIPYNCLLLAFYGGNQKIIRSCLKYNEPNSECMKTAIFTHNIDNINILLNEYNINIEMRDCAAYDNIQAFLILFNQSNDIDIGFLNSTFFNIPTICNYFISIGADIKWLFSALQIVAEYDNKETAEFLISHGITLEYSMPLHFALKSSSKKVLKVLIKHGANINDKTSLGSQAIHFAAAFNDVNIAQILVSHGADINSKNFQGLIPLHIAVSNGRKEMVEYLLLKGSNVNSKDIHDATPLHYAAFSNNIEIMQLLISYGAKINSKDEEKRTPLHYAGKSNSADAARLLISYGANINSKDDLGDTPLHMAVVKHNFEVSQVPISYGADVNLKNNYGFTTLHITAFLNYKDIAIFLFQHGADINILDNNNRTTLDIAIKSSFIETFLYLQYNIALKEVGEL
ncbi:ankyrin repeat protein, putative [Trichomonas vaginalis G3]|uniref:Ankyrin repeat protein, putative n=1 Tax=Trichomonas vaginalis (strain ATCC PRA-98 / G3) TaxID=412133 RepID=A2DA93_TRIV3|nr:spectrin binding [Trichomonas vaginalis G3]EAY22741.1 ankyrin repeat protein, putative [Trichomonas vaginalis G3]KAI5525552.1 spectrin binding [Trichomonas vaginalis G3]|eukprot:XP_001583727.1 ankyrin repeat protein [Trichomonas vaginalis G3]